MSAVKSRSIAEPAAPSQQSLLALSWLNFFLSGMQTAFGPIAAAYLVMQGWTAKDIGLALFALISNPLALMIIQLQDVIIGAVLGVMMAVIIADVTKGTRRFNLAQGIFGTAMGVGATLSI